MYILRALALLFLTQAVVAQQPLLEGALPFTVADLRQSLGGRRRVHRQQGPHGRDPPEQKPP